MEASKFRGANLNLINPPVAKATNIGDVGVSKMLGMRVNYQAAPVRNSFGNDLGGVSFMGKKPKASIIKNADAYSIYAKGRINNPYGNLYK
jgi:hypothetical protein